MRFVLSKNKRPIDPFTGIPHDITDPSIHLTASDAQALAVQWRCEVGAVMAPPYFCIDIDHAVNDGQWSQLSKDLVNSFTGAYVETSRSGTGLHIIGKYTNEFEHACKNVPLGIECYTADRHIVLTGNDRRGSWDSVQDAALSAVVASYFKPSTAKTSADWTSSAVAEWTGSDDDSVLIQKATASKSVFGSKASFAELWNCKTAKLSQSYPSDTSEFDRSSADMALCIHLAFWTGKNCERMERLFNNSALVRDKWKTREQYRKDTILTACARVAGVYSVGTKVDTTGIDGIRNDLQHMAIDKQIEHFKGFVYVADQNKVIVPGGKSYTMPAFKATFGGYVFSMDSIADKTSKNAWEVFTESQSYNFPKAYSTAFRPLEAPEEIISIDGADYLNTWRVLNVACVQGDVSLFLDLMKKHHPNPRDCEIIISYMAACVQHQGVKFQWWPVIQGTQGNGKTFAARAVMQAIGLAHCHVPSAKDLGNKFNAWIKGKTFAFADEIDDLDYKDQDVLKTLIASDLIDVQGKGSDQVMGENCANGMMCMNPRDGIRVDNNERRYAVFFTAQQDYSDLKRDGMTGDYFTKLWNWARGGGYANITHYLRTYKIKDEFNPATGCRGRAPETSSSVEVLKESLTIAELDIIEFCEQGALGMSGGWISSLSLTRYLNTSRKRIPKLLKGLGYIEHPGLVAGRATRVIPFDQGKPKLYIKAGHISAGINNPDDVMRAFIKSQNEAVNNDKATFPLSKM